MYPTPTKVVYDRKNVLSNESFFLLVKEADCPSVRVHIFQRVNGLIKGLVGRSERFYFFLRFSLFFQEGKISV